MCIAAFPIASYSLSPFFLWAKKSPLISRKRSFSLFVSDLFNSNVWTQQFKETWMNWISGNRKSPSTWFHTCIISWLFPAKSWSIKSIYHFESHMNYSSNLQYAQRRGKNIFLIIESDLGEGEWRLIAIATWTWK